MKKELQIILGFNCNFSCSHCLNNSRPGYREFDISPEEIQQIKRDIENDSGVTIVSFSGGEPLLYLESIANIVNFCREVPNRKIQFSITTNGSLLEKYLTTLEPLKIDYCTISYDHSHSKFIDEETLSKRLEIAKAVFTKTEINFVFSDINEVHLVKKLATNFGVKVNFNKQIQSGRSNTQESSDQETSSFQCPNMSNKDLLKISFVPRRGYSVCCGPIIFDKLVSDQIAYSSQTDLIEQSPLFKFLKIAEQESSVAKSDISCNQCRNLVSTRKFTEFMRAL